MTQAEIIALARELRSSAWATPENYGSIKAVQFRAAEMLETIAQAYFTPQNATSYPQQLTRDAVLAIMTNIAETEDDGWNAWCRLRSFLDEKISQPEPSSAIHGKEDLPEPGDIWD